MTLRDRLHQIRRKNRIESREIRDQTDEHEAEAFLAALRGPRSTPRDH